VNLYRSLGRLDTWELVHLGLVLGVALMERADTGEPDPVTEQTVRLGEDDLRRLEDGDSVRVYRWHGHELEVRGDLVVDVEAVETEQNDGSEGGD